MGLLCVIVGFIVEQGDRERNPLSGTGAYPSFCVVSFNQRTLSQTHVISVTDRGSENWILCERGQENTSRKGKENKDEAFLFTLNRVVLSVLLIVHNKDLRSLNYRLWACTIWLAMCFALFTATSKSQLLMKNRKKKKGNERTVWEGIWKNNDATARKYKNATTQHQSKKRHWLCSESMLPLLGYTAF